MLECNHSPIVGAFLIGVSLRLCARARQDAQEAAPSRTALPDTFAHARGRLLCGHWALRQEGRTHSMNSNRCTIHPVEKRFLYHDFFSPAMTDAEFESKPQVSN